MRRDWLASYDRLPEGPGVVTIQSWDTASKPGIQNDFSVCITARFYRNQLYIVDVYRARLSFPDLKAKVIELARLHGCQRLFIEDAASGIELIQVLNIECPARVPRPLRCAPAGHKETRFSAQTHHMADGHLLLPSEAPWLAGYVTELMGFPNARYDDQADATAQLLAHAFLWRDDSPGGGAISSDYLDPSPDDDVDEWPWNEDFYAIRWR